MKNGIWTRIKRYFSKKEAWGNPEAISGLLLMVLYQIRLASGWPIVIHCGTQGKHCENSYHYKGLAVDFHFDTNVPLIEQIQLLFNFFEEMQLTDFVGLGAYSYWNNPGWHLDVRGHKARWLCVKKGEYLPFSASNLKLLR